jgi:hypothetical protein
VCYFSLETEEGEIREHIVGYYKQLFGKECRGALRLEEDFWVATRSLSEQETAGLVELFSEEIKTTLDEMKTSFAPGPGGLPTEFYKFWRCLRNFIKES